MKKVISICLSLSLFLVAALPARAGGSLDEIDITGRVASPIPGEIVARIVPIKWDARTLPVRYSVNNTLNPIPNPLGESFLSLEQATAALQRSFDSWNNIPTSYINMRIVNQTNNSGLAGFDMVNELTFRTPDDFGAIAFSPSVSLIEDVTLVDGDRLDNDEDSDVSGAISAARDVDGDGDIEFPAGFYKAGTILDNDVAFNTNSADGFRFTVDPAAADTTFDSIDLEAVATHEFGHSHGLAHSLVNQISKTNGNGATMFPFIDTSDPASELSQRTVETDDTAYSSFLYQEGTASGGPAALQRGDVGFNRVFGLIKGELRHGELEQPILGGNLFAVNLFDKSITSSAYSGEAQLSFNPASGDLSVPSAEFAIRNGNYAIPVPLGLYEVGTEAVDGLPVPAGSVNFVAIIGSILGQQNYNEEFYSAFLESDVEERPGLSIPVPVLPGKSRDNVNIVTNRTININNFDSFDSVAFVGAQPGTYYALQVPAEQIEAATSGQNFVIQAAAYHTFASDASTVPVFAEALLTTGTVDESGTAQVNLTNPLARAENFVGQDNDFAPFYFNNPRLLGYQVRQGINRGEIQNLFLVLRVPQRPFPGVNNRPPLVGLDALLPSDTAPRLSYVSNNNGATFNRRNDFNFRFSLVLSEPRF